MKEFSSEPVTQDEEIIGVLMGISAVSRRLAKNLIRLQCRNQIMKGERKNERNGRPRRRYSGYGC